MWLVYGKPCFSQLYKTQTFTPLTRVDGFRRYTEHIVIALVGTLNRTVGLAGQRLPMANFQFMTHWSNFLPNYLSKLTAVTTLRNRWSSKTVNMSNKTKRPLRLVSF
jgi:hypothetical protein